MNHTKTDRGRALIEFGDAHGMPCVVRESPFVPWKGEDARVFLGRRGKPMHLTQSMVRDLLPMLEHFAEHGELPEVEE